MPASADDRDLIRRIRTGEESAWTECIARYEGRLQAFVVSRLRDRAMAEDLVQEAFVGFLTALPNYDDQTPVETFLFAITAHKITDALRRQGRRPTLPLNASDGGDAASELPGSARVASSIARSQERRGGEEELVAGCLQLLIQQWRQKEEFIRLHCVELLFVKGVTNKQAAEMLGLSEQEVANHKFFVVSKLKEAARAAGRDDFDPRDFGIL